MRKFVFTILIIPIFLLAIFYFASFFIPEILVIEKEITPAAAFPALKAKKINKETLTIFEEKKEELIFQKKDFLEVNLSEMKLRLYEKGFLKKEFSILTKGDPQGWGGSAVGLYKIISGSKVSFSGTADVYMPYALRYYGKYYIHGEPYQADGEKLDSLVSGGCLRLSNENAEEVYQLTELDLPVLVIDKEKDNYEYTNLELSTFPALSAQSYLVADLDSGYVFQEKNSQKQLPIASLTKLMTATVVAENIDLRKSILVKEEMLEGYGSTEGLEKGKWFRVVELFYPLLIESSNDAAETLSYFLGRAKTIELMNEKAKAILMENTHFAGPSGFDPENVSTAKDLFYLARYILNNRPPILEITKGKEVLTFGPLDFEIEDLWNKNVFINDETFIGGKTGFIKISKHTAVFIFRFEDKIGEERRIAIILLGSDNDKLDTQRTYIWLQKNFF